MAAALGLLVAVPAHAAGGPDRLQILDLLRDRQFDRLERQLDGYLARYEAGETSDEVVRSAYKSFASADPDLEPLLNAWIAKQPQSTAARMARASYYLSLAWVLRGSAWTQNTARVRIDAMERYMDLARTDLRAVILLNPRQSIAYAALINIGMAMFDEASTDFLVRMGLKASPRSFVIRENYVYSLSPWWRGNDRPRNPDAFGNFLRGWMDLPKRPPPPTTLEVFLGQIERDAARYPELAELKGYGDYVTGKRHLYRKEYARAIEYYNKAQRHTDGVLYLWPMGKAYFYLERYKDAVTVFTNYLRAKPQRPDVLSFRARAYGRLGKLDEALDDWDEALTFTPYEPDILLQKAYALKAARRYPEAVEVLTDALVYGADDANVRYQRGWMLLRKLDRPADAIADLARAAELYPRNRWNWYTYGVALHKIKSCSAIQALTNYRNLCRGRERCRRKDTDWALNTIREMKRTAACRAQGGG